MEDIWRKLQAYSYLKKKKLKFETIILIEKRRNFHARPKAH